MIRKISTLTASTFVLMVATLTPVTFAVGNANVHAQNAPGASNVPSNPGSQGQGGQPSNPGSQGQGGQPSNPGSQGSSKASAGQQKACQNREAAIDGILNRIVTRGQNQLNLFSTIAQRVESFATSKNVTVSSTILAQLQADNTKATNDLASMKANVTINCSSSDPKATVDAFKNDLQLEISDLQTYRTDVKNLIVQVKTALSQTSTTPTTTTSNSGNTNSNTGTTTTGGTQ